MIKPLVANPLLRSFIIYGLGTGLSQSILIFLVPVYTNHFSKAEYGVLESIISAFVLFSILGTLQIESAAGRFYFDFKNDKDRSKHISTGLWSIFFLSCLIILCPLIFVEFLTTFLFGSNEFVLAVIIAFCIIPLANIYNYFNVLIRFDKKPIVYCIATLCQVLFTISVSIFLVVIKGFGISSVFVGQLVGYVFGLTFYLIYFRKDIISFLDKSILRKYLKFSLPVVPAVLGSWGNNHANRFAMLSMLSLSEIGLYMVAYKIASVFKLLEIAFRMAWQPFFIEEYNKDGAQLVFKKIALIVVGIISILVILSFLLSSPLVRLLTSPEYYECADLIGWLSLAFGLVIISSCVNLGPVLKKRTIFNTYSYLISIAFNFIALFILVPKYGIMGAAISLAIGNLMLLVFSFIFSEKLYPIFTTK